MQQQHFTKTIVTDRSPEEVFKAINNVYEWWSQDFKGRSQQVGDEFSVRFEDVHYSRHKLTESIPNEKVVWLVTDSQLNFLQNKKEWDGTENIFTISRQGNRTKLLFTHVGLVPDKECFDNCSGGWSYYLASLENLITKGEGKPHKPGTKIMN